VAVCALAALAFSAPAWAQRAAPVPYTVQVAALSDSESAIDLSGALLRDGFPAYVVRAEGAAGSVFRVRVAAFGDRVSAERYALALGERRGGEPRPALAEAIPSGILPLAPTRLVRVEGDGRAVVLAWGEDGIMVRSGPENGAAEYRSGDGGAPFTAWWAAPREGGGRDEVARLPLDDPAAASDEPAVRDALFRQRLRLVADQTGLDADRLEAEAVRGEPGERHLVVWRTVGPDEGVRSVARADASPASREPDAWLGEVPPERQAVMLVLRPGPADGADASVEAGAGPGADATPPADADAGAADAPADEESANGDAVAGLGWSARSDGIWTVLEVGAVTWRALVGAPVAAAEDLLVLEVDGATELVRLAPR
jgi:hypothetical protein